MKFKLIEKKTVGTTIYDMFKHHNKNVKFPKLTYDHYASIQKDKIAGRVEMFNGIQEITEKMASIDVCSIYPYVMCVLNGYYPCGDIIETENYKGDDTLGFYYCDIDQSNLRINNKPNIYAFKTKEENNWDYKGILENYFINNIDIGILG